jgi:hypothetical protein
MSFPICEYRETCCVRTKYPVVYLTLNSKKSENEWIRSYLRPINDLFP